AREQVHLAGDLDAAGATSPVVAEYHRALVVVALPPGVALEHAPLTPEEAELGAGRDHTLATRGEDLVRTGVLLVQLAGREAGVEPDPRLLVVQRGVAGLVGRLRRRGGTAALAQLVEGRGVAGLVDRVDIPGGVHDAQGARLERERQ